MNLSRRLVQLYAALLYNAHLKGFVKGSVFQGVTKGLCVPGLNCYSCPGAVGACPLGTLQNALSRAGHTAAWYVVGVVALFGLTLGRTICGWLCPFGLLQELLDRLPLPKIRKGRVTRALSRLKYAVLAVFAVLLPVYYGLSRGVAVPAFCKYICPAGTLEGAVALLAHPGNGGLFSMLGALFTGKFVILIAVLLACACCYRAFCRFLCPLGAIYSLFSRVALTGVRVDADKCVRCGACARACPVDIRSVGDGECVSCGKCLGACRFGAISFRCGPLTLRSGGPDAAPSRGVTYLRRAVAACAAALLVGLIVWANGPASGGSAPAETAAVEQGHEPGRRLPDFSVICLDGSAYTLSEHRGEVVVINLWATYCAPCLQEMPLFTALEAAHPGEVSVLTVHPQMAIEDVAAFVAARGDFPRYAAWDEDGALWPLFGASSLLPQTLVLDRSGVVVYNAAGSVTAELLESLWEEGAS